MRKFQTLFASIALTLCGAGLASASGYGYDIGIRARALGGAFRAIADDWTATAYNPAGLAYIKDNQLGGVAGFHHNRFTYTPDYFRGASAGQSFQTGYVNGTEVANRYEIGFTPEAGLIIRTPFWNETVVGFSIYQTHDQDLDWSLFNGIEGYSSFVFSSDKVQQSIDMDIVNFQLTAAREFSDDKLSIGLGLSLVRADLIYRTITLRDNPMDPALVVRPYEKIPEFTAHDGFGWGLGAKLGILWKPIDKLRVAVTANPKTTITVDGPVTFQFFLPEDLDLRQSEGFIVGQDEYLLTSGFTLETAADFKVEVVAPASFAAGLAFDLGEKTTVSLDGVYTLWSQFKGFDFTYDRSSFDSLNITSVSPPPKLTGLAQTDLSYPVEWDNAGSIMLGLSHEIKPFLTAMFGFRADQAAASPSTAQPHFIDNGTTHTGSFGLSITMERWDLNFMTSLKRQPDLTVTDPFDSDSDGLIDNLPASVSGDVYQTAFGFSYRF